MQPLTCVSAALKGFKTFSKKNICGSSLACTDYSLFEDSTYYYESGSLTYLLKKYIVKILNISYYIFGSNLPCSDFFFLFSKRDVSIFFHEPSKSE